LVALLEFNFLMAALAAAAALQKSHRLSPEETLNHNNKLTPISCEWFLKGGTEKPQQGQAMRRLKAILLLR
jgi:hypothetical protein